MSIVQELENFSSLWENAMAGNPLRPQDIDNDDWQKLGDWACGNSISVDQNTIQVGRRTLDLLIAKRRDQLMVEEILAQPSPDVYRFRDWPGSPFEGTGEGHESYNEDFNMQTPCVRCNNFRTTDQQDPGGFCTIFQDRVTGDAGGIKGGCNSHIQHNGNPIHAPSDGDVRFQDLRNKFGPHLWYNRIDRGWRQALNCMLWLQNYNMGHLINSNGARVTVSTVEEMLENLDNNTTRAAFRLTPEWNLYILARYGGMDDPNSLIHFRRAPTSVDPLITTDLHIVLGETITRNFVLRQGQQIQWGTGQYQVRTALCDSSQTDSIGDFVTVEQYYECFRNNNCIHMADQYFMRSIQDQNAAHFEFVDTAAPEHGRIYLDERLVRWREYNRIRGRGFGGN